MAARGTTGTRAVEAWLRIISDEAHPERLTDGIAANGTFTQWELLSGIVTKYYAAPGPLAAPVEAMFTLVEQHDIRPEQVDAIHADCTRRTAIFKEPHPSDELEARGSLPYCLAIALCTRDPALLLGPGYRGEMLNDPAIRADSSKVHVTANEEYEKQYPARSLAKITIALRDGRSHSLEVDRSEIRRYLTPTDADIERKFRMIATPGLGERKTSRVVELALDMENVGDISKLIESLQPE
jgi:2-methylcitrate dehydratase PrpD